MTFNECTTSSRREVQDKNLIAVEEHTSKRFVRKIIRSIDKSEKTLTKHLNLAIIKSISNGRHQTLQTILKLAAIQEFVLFCMRKRIQSMPKSVGFVTIFFVTNAFRPTSYAATEPCLL